MNEINSIVCVILSTLFKHSIDAFVEIGNYSGSQINIPECGLRFQPKYLNLTFDLKCFHKKYEPIRVTIIEGIHFYRQKDSPQNRIQFGRIASYAEAPWAVYILRHDYSHKGTVHFSCNGVLITFEWILTTAQCLNDTNFETEINAGSGRKVGLEEREYGKTFIHPLYYDDKSTPAVRRANDIALFKTDKKFKQKLDGRHLKINPICLPTRTRFNSDYELMTYYAFKQYKYAKDKRLKTAETRLTPYSDCPKEWPYLLCSLYNNSFDKQRPSLGDLGAGLVYYIDKYRSRAILVGLLTGESVTSNDYCPDGRTHLELCIAYWVPISLHIDWILSTIANY